MEIENVRCLEVAAQLALINMLKVNLSCCPDIYRTLLAILCDFDPDESDSKEKVYLIEMRGICLVCMKTGIFSRKAS